MLFRQLYEPESSTYTYLIGCEETGECVLIDPVLEAAERDLTVVQELDLRLAMTIETHNHLGIVAGDWGQWWPLCGSISGGVDSWVGNAL